MPVGGCHGSPPGSGGASSALAAADDPPQPYVEEPPYEMAPHLLGAQDGFRERLAAAGVTILADNTGFFIGNTNGGFDQAFDYAGHGDYCVIADGGKLGVHDGLYLKLRAEHRYGETIVGNVGCFISPTLIADLPVYDSEELYLTNVLLTQELTDAFSVFAGKMDTLDGDMNAFAHGRGKTQFSNMGFVFNPIVGATVPYSTLGAGIRAPSRRRADGDGDRAQLDRHDGHERLRHALQRRHAPVGGRAGAHELPRPSGPPAAGRHLEQPHLHVDRRGLHPLPGRRHSDDPRLVVPVLELRSISCSSIRRTTTRGWGPFGRAGIADPNTSPIDAFLSFGVGGNVPGRRRRDDTFGVGWYWASASPQIGTLITSQFGPVGDGQGIECFYNYALTPAVRITPDLQYVVPTLRLAEPALIAGVRALVSF